MSGQQPIESHGTPHMDARPVDFPCQALECDKFVRSYLTDENVEAHETTRVYRPTPETGDEPLIRYWFCSPDYRDAFVNTIKNGDCEETLYEDSG